MKKQRPVAAILLAIVLFSCLPARANSNLWSIHTENSSVDFQIRYLMVAPVKGEFKSFSGTVNYDGSNLQDASVIAEIIVNSIDTGIPKRDLHLKKNDFFDIMHYQTISFKSRKIIPQQSGAFQIIGTLSMHGVLKQVTLNAQPLKEGTDAAGKIKLTTVATTTVNRKDFGISMGWMDQGGAGIGDKVKVTLNIELLPAG